MLRTANCQPDGSKITSGFAHNEYLEVQCLKYALILKIQDFSTHRQLFSRSPEIEHNQMKDAIVPSILCRQIGVFVAQSLFACNTNATHYPPTSGFQNEDLPSKL
ncbi:hypothetical protein C8R43DRAFT_954910 [Mycena crocata]|nr:hypothetical protein C8R43DRAFT_954898 [Mycena crocata]KAJ7140168.1 hypothetical protein C8R43DRAFT_954904 [Mycena crocata]KAJ7140174.1 hypothetical protein C8R43DRAFT_954910 [Mycena crocata]